MRVFKTIAVTLFLMLGCSLSIFAQNREVSGKVFDANQQPLVGAAVMLPGTTNGAVTIDDGSFSLTIPAGDVTVEVSSLGYLTRKVTIPAAKSSITIFLEEDNLTLNETVVVGYGTQKKVNLTGAITTVDSKSLENRVSHSLTNMLQGSVPGLNISTSSGNPGSSGSLNIRGTTSINASSPLVIVDGAEGDMSRVNANDVASISVIKDAAAAAVYGARAAYGVILITTKSGAAKEGKATVRYNGRFGWESPTTSTDYETTGYWSVYTVNLFWKADTGGTPYCNYTDNDMMQLLARVNDKTENPDRPWVIEEVRNGRNQWVYYCNTDWYHELYRDNHPVQQHNISVTGGSKGVKYYLSGAYDRQTGMLKQDPDVFGKYNLRAKFDFDINKYMKMSNNTSFYSSTYSYKGVDNVQNALAYSARHALACFPLKNPDGTWLYSTPYLGYKVANGRHAIFGNDYNVNKDRKSDFTNTTELRITPVKTFTLTANYTYRLRQNRNTNRRTSFDYREYPDGPMQSYTTGAGQDRLYESVGTWNYYATNVFGTYHESFNNAHNVTVMAGFNYEAQNYKAVSAEGLNLMSKELNDLDLVGPNEAGDVLTSVGGGQSQYALAGFFGRINYDYKGRYLFEVSGRYDGSSRFAKGSRWGFFPSASAGWRISEEPFFSSAKNVVNNLKLRASFGSLGNQNVANYAYLRTISISDFKGYSFGEGTTMSKYASISAPNASDLTWETSQQYNVGLDAGLFNDRLSFTAEAYIRDTKNMLTAGKALPSIYGASSPKMNAADLRTSGYELSLSWRDMFKLAGKPFGYGVTATLSDYRSVITKYDNPEKSFADSYYEGKRIGEIWGFVVDGLFDSTEEAQAYAKEVDLGYFSKRLTHGWQGGDLKYVDLDGDGKIGLGQNTVNNPGDRKIIGNSLASLQYGFNFSFDWLGFDFNIFLQGTGNHYWYPTAENMQFWGPYSTPYTSFLPKNFLDNCWDEDNKDAYFPRPRAYAANSTVSPLGATNTRYLQNLRYLRLKSLTIGYTIPEKLTSKIKLEQVRFYFSGENLAYWSPIKKYSKFVDPEAAFNRDSAYNNFFYPWPKTIMFGIDLTF